MEKLWKKQAITIPTNRSTFRAMIGNFQRQTCWDSAGYVYVITAENNGAGNTPRISVYRSINGNFDLSAGFTFQADTSIANGYPDDEISALSEFSAELRNNRIYIVSTFTMPPSINLGIVLIAYDINTRRFERIDYRASLTWTPPIQTVGSVDISLSPRRAHGDIIVSWLEMDSIITPTMLARRYLRDILASATAPGYGGIGYSDQVFILPDFIYPCFLSNFRGDNELWGVQKIQNIHIMSLYSIVNLPGELLRGSSAGPNEMYLGTSTAEPFGDFKAIYNGKYNIEIMAYWKILPPPGSGWALEIGIRGQEGVYETFQLAEFNYSNLGVGNVLADIPYVRPEVLIAVDDQGGTYIIASYPSQSSRPLSGTPGPGRIDNPYYNIAMAYWATDDFNSLDGVNYETVWNGQATQTQIRYLSAPDMFPAGDSSTIRATKLFFTCVDMLNAPQGQVVIYRD